MKLWRKFLCWYYRKPLWYFHRALIKKPDGRIVEEYGMFWCPNCEKWIQYSYLNKTSCDSCGAHRIVNAVDV